MQIHELRCTTYHSANPIPVPQAVQEVVALIRSPSARAGSATIPRPKWTSMDLNHFEALVAYLMRGQSRTMFR